ncbi:Transcriptional protein SWT1 [Collichthys lucidus]|uniref:Transcriptional protein SWT1 n=1 Tax=Collichthys lucidus TaxID=240159 RepID=A0A4U5TWK3_COLLU|nr:Transcriptional protein SWT1 [Collichthys lucidus]
MWLAEAREQIQKKSQWRFSRGNAKHKSWLAVFVDGKPQQDLILVLDTNILLSHLDYVKKMRSHGLAGLGFPVILLPWVVLQEMDSLKKGKDLTGSVAHLAVPAISYVYNTLTSREPRLWGQSMQQAAEINNGLNAEKMMTECCSAACNTRLCTQSVLSSYARKTVDCSTTLAALQEAKELVKVFGKRSRRVPGAISILDNIFNKLQPQGESPACDVIMNDDADADDEDEQPVSARVPHQEVWALFENICSEVFKALGFDPHTMQSAQPVGGPSPPQDALVCLHKLSSMVLHLLHAFSSVLSSAPGLEEAQTLLNIIHSNEIANVDSRLTAKDLIDCFSQQDYR